MSGHHLILGELKDIISGETIDDTLDERLRQKIARLLITVKGYPKKDIEPRRKLQVQADRKKAIIKIDFVIRIDGKASLLIKYGPGSLVTRRRPALAVSRLIESYQIPFVVVTNGEDAEIIRGATGDVIGHGIESIPHRSALADLISIENADSIPPKRAEMESRIVYCYEVDGACPCDETVCRL